MNIMALLEKKIRLGKLLEVRLGTVVLFSLAFPVISFMWYLHLDSVNKTKSYFKEQYEETVKSNLQTLKLRFKEQVNFLTYDLNNSVGTLPKGVNVRSFVYKNIGEIISSRNYIEKVYYLDTLNKRCFLFFPKLDTIRQPLKFVDFDGLNFRTGKISKNLMYVYIPNPTTERVDSVIWGLVSVPVYKVFGKKRLRMGLLFVLINVSSLMDQLSKEIFGKKSLKLALIPLSSGNVFYPKSVGLKWDNYQLNISYKKPEGESLRWEANFNRVKDRMCMNFSISAIAVFLVFVAAGSIYEKSIRRKDNEVNEAENERSILEKSSEKIENVVELSSPEDLMFSILDDFKEKTNISYVVSKNGEVYKYSGKLNESEAIEILNETQDEIEKGVKASDSKYPFKKITLDGESYLVILRDAGSAKVARKRQFYLIFLFMLELATRYSFKSEQKREIEENIFLTILKILGLKDNYTCDHSLSVAEIAVYIGEKIGKEKYNLKDYDIDILRMAGYLHDIGKMGIPDEILNKLGAYDELDIKVMRRHPLYTKAILQPLAKHIKYYKDIMNVAVHHHERLDGSGYPFGLKGKDFTIPMQILAIADSLDAMMRDRPYKSAKSLKDIREDLSSLAGTKFNRKLVKEVIKILEEIYNIPGRRKREHCDIKF